MHSLAAFQGPHYNGFSDKSENPNNYKSISDVSFTFKMLQLILNVAKFIQYSFAIPFTDF